MRVLGILLIAMAVLSTPDEVGAMGGAGGDIGVEYDPHKSFLIEKAQQEPDVDTEPYEILLKCARLFDFTLWEEYRKTNSNDIASHRIRLNGADFQNVNLRGVDLSHADLRGAIFISADLSESNLFAANLQEADFYFATLREANLESADLRAAFLSYADLVKAVLRKTNLQNAELGRTNLQEAHLQEANLQKAILTYANLQEAFLWNANLQRSMLQYANLQKADLMNANLQEAFLWNTNLQETDLRGANLMDANLQKTDLQKANLQKADLTNANLQEANLWNANLQKSTLWNAYLQGSSLRLVDLRGSNLQNAKLHNADFENGDLAGASFIGTLIDGATSFIDCTADRETDFTATGLDNARITPKLHTYLKTNIRRLAWQRWYAEETTGWIARSAARAFWFISDYGASTKRILFGLFAAALLFFCPTYLLISFRAPYVFPSIEHPRKLGGGVAWFYWFAQFAFFSFASMVTFGFDNIYVKFDPYRPKWPTIALCVLTLNLMTGYFLLACLVTRIGIMFQALGP